MVKEICVGTGPCGELRYPAYQEKGQKWSYMGEKMGVEGQIQVPSRLPVCGHWPEGVCICVPVHVCVCAAETGCHGEAGRCRIGCGLDGLWFSKVSCMC